MYSVYLLQSMKDASWYIGYTSDLKKRLQAHQRGENASTSFRGELKLIYYEAYLHKMDAIGRERFLKSGSGRKFLKKQLTHYLEAFKWFRMFELLHIRYSSPNALDDVTPTMFELQKGSNFVIVVYFANLMLYAK